MGRMQAAVVETFGQSLVLRELPAPTPSAGEVLVKTDACGVCHTAAAGHVVADIELQPLAAVNDVLTRLKQGNVLSRVGLDVAGSAHRRL